MTTNHQQFLSSPPRALIVEDDPYNELYFEDSAAAADVRPMKADDREGRVIYLSSFSKTLAAALDADKMITRVVEQGVIYVAGAAFYVNGEGYNTLRLSFSAPPPERIEAGISRLALTVRAESEALATAAATAAPEAS